MECAQIPDDSMGAHLYRITVPAIHELTQYTLRVMPCRAGVSLPLEVNHILWDH